MSVVAAAAVGPPAPVVAPAPAVAPFGLYGGGGGGGARKRKDVVRPEETAEDGGGGVHGLFVLETVVEEEAEAEGERSSIGAVSDDEAVEDGDEAESSPGQRKKKAGLACLDALDDALPIKRGLSSFFSGKSRSFANLQDVVAVAGETGGANVLAKPENPFNKRRRVLRCSSMRRVSSTSLTALPPFLPPGPRPSSFNIGNDDSATNGGGGGSG
ncbi:uncharacterized protein LOC100838878 [Brachypodium distachyon]|uniref:Uncharacterized protein n=1 Tax=Brachypodium distachyon TaxID=15368 RepID=I1GWL4_BRADI|nr:uncharacterized protein LOC100838878 [Brachypodium distachyon]KQK17358.1 hypothetical protein BRADI_1g33950v3 [Brachypodium distachyon]|eukprot:XP_003563490.1 uncharacterized protein LOC100838878 [Brachypodium distachyon]